MTKEEKTAEKQKLQILQKKDLLRKQIKLLGLPDEFVYWIGFYNGKYYGETSIEAGFSLDGNIKENIKRALLDIRDLIDYDLHILRNKK